VYDWYYSGASSGKGTSYNINSCYNVASFHQAKICDQHSVIGMYANNTVLFFSDGTTVDTIESIVDIQHLHPKRLCPIAKFALLRQRQRSHDNGSIEGISFFPNKYHGDHKPNGSEAPRSCTIGHRDDV
jgi:hypothetical protein